MEFSRASVPEADMLPLYSPPPLFAELSEMTALVTTSEPTLSLPPPSDAVLPEIVQLINVSVPVLLLYRPPPLDPTELLEMVASATANELALKMPPFADAVLPATVKFDSDRATEL